MKTKPFDIEQAKAGAKVVTRAGRRVRIVCFDGPCKKYPICGFIEKEDLYARTWSEDGLFDIAYTRRSCNNLDYDLLLVDDAEPEYTDFERAVADIIKQASEGSKIYSSEGQVRVIAHYLLDLAYLELNAQH